VSGSEARRLGRPARLGATCRVLRRLRRDNCRCTCGKLAHDQVAPSSHSLSRARAGGGDLITSVLTSPHRALRRATKPDQPAKPYARGYVGIIARGVGLVQRFVSIVTALYTLMTTSQYDGHDDFTTSRGGVFFFERIRRVFFVVPGRCSMIEMNERRA